jgi:NAD(P)-dependent dehydrogenase (short-subunit alcohol dehydrogenase family)
VVIVDVDATAGEAQAAQLGGNARFAKTDVTDEASASAAIEMAVNEFGALHGLVNCAGVAPPKKVLGRNGPHDLATFARVVSINLVGTFNMIRLAAEAMSKNEPNDGGERGVIVNTASVAAYDGQIGQAAYASSKAGGGRPDAAGGARTGGAWHPGDVTIAPGIFETPMLKGLPQAASGFAGQDGPVPVAPGQARRIRRAGPAHLREHYLNGEVIRLDGAIRMAPK